MLKVSREHLQRILAATRWVERMMRNPRSQRGRWQGRGGGGFDRCTGTLAVELTSGVGPFNVDLVKVISGTSPLDDPDSTTETVSAYNTMTWTADDGAVCRIEWNKTEERWEFYQVDGCSA